ncbi:MAG: hypothetical protein CVV64_20420 [Candidatus Wallbacteria bacterium HGW-Wallbacteria-1]|jgi:hypothetical protein|uniref:Uncharacterized protein n=1 Tax=Candidatus Wallbacteria bacterium HGW-Wallbacteria-1 TaxID=2013854 RepID=A0A2N1PIB2_9BACT|nr:MAG: hypothetical protein CVV64_20420 [Candidatus Wallbacteria bacterium HGW-Wallbacteria-1]
MKNTLLAIPLFLVLLLGLTPGISMMEDLGRHLLLGKIILQNHSVPTVNLLTFTFPDYPFVNHHWLSEVIFYLVHSVSGLNGLILLKIFLMTGSLLLALGSFQSRSVSSLNRPSGLLNKSSALLNGSSALMALTGIISAIILGFRSHIRPELFTYFGMALFLYCFERIRHGHRYPWAILALCAWFWANAHIYFIFGLGMLGAFLLERWWHQWLKGHNGFKSVPWCEAAAVAGIFLLCTLQPNGLYGFIYPFMIFTNYGMAITENGSSPELWQLSLNPALMALPILTMFSVIALLKVTIIRPRNDQSAPLMANYIILVTSLIAAWSMIRSLPLLAIAAIPVISEAIDLLNHSLASSDTDTSNDTITSSDTDTSKDTNVCNDTNVSIISTETVKSGSSGQISAIAVVILGFWLIHGVLNGWYFRIFPSPMGPTPFGLEREEDYLALRKLKADGLPGPIFSDYNIGSLVEYCIYPEKGYVDNRPEAFPEEFWTQEYMPFLALGRKWDDMIRARSIQSVVVSPTGVREPFFAAMMKNNSWRLVHLDHVAAVWVLADNPDNREFIEKHLYTDQSLENELQRIRFIIDSVDQTSIFRRQILVHEAAYRLYSLLCIGAIEKLWPLLWNLHEKYPDYQILHEMLRVTAPPERVDQVKNVMRKAARWPLSVKQIMDWSAVLESEGKVRSALETVHRGKWFFWFSPQLRQLGRYYEAQLKKEQSSLIPAEKIEPGQIKSLQNDSMKNDSLQKDTKMENTGSNQ